MTKEYETFCPEACFNKDIKCADCVNGSQFEKYWGSSKAEEEGFQ